MLASLVANGYAPLQVQSSFPRLYIVPPCPISSTVVLITVQYIYLQINESIYRVYKMHLFSYFFPTQTKIWDMEYLFA